MCETCKAKTYLGANINVLHMECGHVGSLDSKCAGVRITACLVYAPSKTNFGHVQEVWPLFGLSPKSS